MKRSLSLAIGVAVLGGVAAVCWWMLSEAQGEPAIKAPAEPPEPLLVVQPPLASAAPGWDGARLVSGVVVSPDGRPVAGTTVALHQELSAWPEWQAELLRTVTTGADGGFSLRSDRTTDLLITVEHELYVSQKIEAPPSLPQLRVVLQPGVTVEGTVVTSDGSPVPRAEVAIEPTVAGGLLVESTTTSNSGRFRCTRVPAGAVRVVARHDRWQPVVRPWVMAGAEQALELRFEQPALTLEGTVVAVTQEPVADAHVWALPPGQQLGRHLPAQAVSDSSGRFRLAGLARGNLRLEVRHAGFAVAERTLVVGPGAPPIEVDLSPRTAVSGRLRAPDGAALGGAVLSLRSAADELDRVALRADGQFTFPRRITHGWATLSLADGRFAFASSAASVLQLRIEEGRGTDLDLVLVAPAVVAGSVVDDGGAPIAGARLSITQAEQVAERLLQAGSALIERDLGKLSDQMTRSAGGEPELLLAATGADGSFRISGLQPGPIAIRVAHEGFGSRRLQLEVPAAGQITHGHKVVMPPGCTIRGRVLRGNRPQPGALVDVRADGLAIVAVAGLDGSYELRDLPPGDYRVRARFSTLPAVPESARASPANAATVDLRFKPMRSISGRVRFRDGQPADGAIVMVGGEAGGSATTEGDGAFVLDAPNRAFDLQVLYGDRGNRHVAAVAADQQTVEIQLDAMPGCTLKAQVFGLPGKKPLPGVLVRLVRVGADGESMAAQSSWVERQGATIRHPWLPAGDWRLSLCCEGYAPFVRDVTLKSGEELPLGEVLLEQGCELRGRVVDEAGRGVPGAEVFLGDEADLDVFQPQVRTGAEGAFTLTGVSTASATLVVRAADHAVHAQPLQLPQDVLGGTPLSVRIARGAVVEVEVDASVGTEGDFVLLRRGNRAPATAEIDGEGRATFRHVGPGAYVAYRFDGQEAAFAVTAADKVVPVRLAR